MAVQILLDANAQMTYTTECYSPFLFAFRNRLSPHILNAFLHHNVNLNMISDHTLVYVPDALLASFSAENRQKLLLLLRCGLRPCLRRWCACHNTHGYSLIEEVRNLDYVGNCSQLLQLLMLFDDALPR